MVMRGMMKCEKIDVGAKLTKIDVGAKLTNRASRVKSSESFSTTVL